MSENSVTTEHYDLIVIGAGSAGVRAARMAAATGIKVAVVERQFLGGTCVNVGCVPKKLFVYASHYGEEFHDAKGFGWQTQPASFDWPTLVSNKNTEIERLNGIYRNLLQNAGVEIIWGSASFVDGQTLAVDDKHLTAEKIIIAVGGKPFVPEFPGSNLVKTSDDMFYLEQLPKRAVVVGGGYIAVEFAGILQGLGVETSLVYRGPQILRTFDADVADFVTAQIKQKGIDVKLNANIEAIEQGANGLALSYNNGDKQETDLVMYATGRSPAFEALGLDNTKVSLDSSGKVVVDDNFETQEPGVYALGDIIPGPELTPVALAEAMVFVDRHYHNNTDRQMDYSNIATAVFCQPNIGTVGLTEAEAREQFGDALDIYKSDFRHLKHTLSGNEERTFMKLIVNKANDVVIGAHMVGSEAGEILQGLGIAVKAGLTKAQWDATIGIHPTAAEEFVTMRTPVS